MVQLMVMPLDGTRRNFWIPEANHQAFPVVRRTWLLKNYEVGGMTRVEYKGRGTA
jgi:hypothetical protein